MYFFEKVKIKSSQRNNIKQISNVKGNTSKTLMLTNVGEKVFY